MSGADKMKYRLANGLKVIMGEKPLDRITVTEIVKASDVTRPTFYHHFKDKYDLVNWYFEKLAQKSFRQMGVRLSLKEGLQKKYELMQEEKIFFIAAFSSEAQNCLIDYDYECIYKFYSDIIHKREQKGISDELDFMLKLYCHGSIDMTAEWAKNGMRELPEQMSDFLIEAMPPKLYELLKNL